MKTENLIQVIVSLIITAICGVVLNMGFWSLFPSLLLGIAWGGVNKTSASEDKKSFWKDFAFIASGAVIMTVIILIGK